MLNRIEDICQEFETDSQRGLEPLIEDYLNRIAVPSRGDLLRRLVATELAIQHQMPSDVLLKDYLRRFPDYEDSVRNALSECQVLTTNEDEPAMETQGLPADPAVLKNEEVPLAADLETLAPETTTGPVDEPTLMPGDTLPPSSENPELATEAQGQPLTIESSMKSSMDFADYEILDEIARGGMGVVYKARQRSLNRVVALKMILSGQFAGEEEVTRFKTEAEAAANLDHWGIVPIYEIGDHRGQHYFSMGFVEGESLQDKIREGPLDPRAAAELCAKTSEAIAYAHSKGVIHRDLKPANVLLDSDSQPKVTDFGLAKQVAGDSNLTQTGAVMGTPSYMPPEQASGDTTQVGPLADVYSLGAILYCLLTGRPPFQASSPIDTLMQVLEEEPVSPRVLNPNVPRDLETITLNCLKKAPEKRYASAQDLVEELKRFLRGDPIVARPVSRVERVWRWTQKHRALAGLYTSIVFLAISGPWVAIRQGRLTKEANQKRIEAESLATRNEQLADQNASISKEEKTQRLEAEKQREEAERQGMYAVQQKEIAEDFAEQNRQQLVNTRLMQGDELVDSKEQIAAALPYYLEALRLDRGHPEQEARHQMRIHAGLASIPKFTQFWRHSESVNHVALDENETRAASASYDRTVQIRNLESGRLECPELAHKFPVWGSAFSRGGNTLATICGTGLFGELRLWNAQTGELLGAPIKSAQNPFHVFWTGEGNVGIASIGLTGGGKLTVYDPLARREILAVKFHVEFNPGVVANFVHAETGRFIQVPSKENASTVNVIDLDESGDVVAVCKHPRRVLMAFFSMDGTRIVTATDSQMYVWNANTGERLVEVESKELEAAGIRPSGNMMCAFSHDNQRVFVGVGKRTFVLDEDGLVFHVKQVPVSGDPSILASPSGRWMVFSDGSSMLRVWDVVGEDFVLSPMQLLSTPNQGTFTKDGRRLLVVGVDGTVCLWDFAATQSQPVKRYRHNIGPVRFAQLSKDESEIITRGHGWMRLLDAATGDVVHHSNLGQDVLWISSPQEGDLAAYGNRKRQAVVFNRRTGEELATLDYRHQNVREVSLSADGKVLGSVSVSTMGGPSQAMGEGHVREVATGKTIAGPLNFKTTESTSFLAKLTNLGSAFDMSGLVTLKVSPSANQVAYAGGYLGMSNGAVEPKLRIRDLASGEETDLECGDGNSWLIMQSLQYSPSGRLLMGWGNNPANGTNSEVRAWDSETKQTTLGPLYFPARVHSVKFSQDEKAAAVAVGEAVYIYDLENSTELCAPLQHSGTVTYVSFSPGGRLATAAEDNSVRVWDLESGRLQLPPLPHQFAVNSVTMPSDDRVMICSFADVFVWKFENRSAPFDDLARSTRLLTTRSLSAEGMQRVTADQMEKDWAVIREAKSSFFNTSQQQVDTWYEKTLSELRNEGDWATATFHRQHLLLKDPSDLDLWNAQANDYGENGQFAKSAECFLEQLKRKPNDGWLMYQLAAALLGTGDQELIQEHCEAFVAAFGETTDPERAEQLGKTLLLCNYRSDESDLPQRLINLAFEQSPNRAWNVVAKSLLEQRAGRFEESVEQASRIINSSLNDITRPLAFTLRAIAKAKLGDSDGARQDLKLARETREDVIRHYGGIWLSLLQLDLLLEEAEPEFAARADRLIAASQETVAESDLAAFEYRLALEQAESANALRPNQRRYLQTLAYAQYRNGQFKNSLDTLRTVDSQSIQTVGHSQPVDVAFMAMALHGLENHSEAQAMLQRAQDMLLSDYWAKDENVLAAIQEATKLIPVPPVDSQMTDDIVEVKNIACRPQQAGWYRHDFDTYMTQWADDAVTVAGRTEQPDEYDIALNREEIAATRKLRFQGTSPLRSDPYTIDHVQVTVDGDTATWKSQITVQFSGAFSNYQEITELRRTDNGWKAAKRRSWIVDHTVTGKLEIMDKERIAELDLELDQELQGEPSINLAGRLYLAGRSRQAWEVCRQLCQRENTTARNWITRAEYAFAIGDANDMRVSMEKVIDLGAESQASSYIRAHAAAMRERSKQESGQ